MASGGLEFEAVSDTRCILGECPVWHGAERALYWIDILGKLLLRLDAAGGETRWSMPSMIGSIAIRQSGGLAVALEGGFYGFDPHTGDPETSTLKPIHDPEPDRPRNRLNDGRCDRAGRFWCGSMGAQAAEKQGTLYRLDPDLSCHAMESGITVPNGLAFGLGNTTMYFTDSRANAVWQYDYDHATGAIENKRDFLTYDDPLKAVDGAAVDEEGFYWGAHMRAGKLARWDPDGKLEREIELPVGRPTMLAFGGVDLDVLYVTSMSVRLSERELASQPFSGRLFAIRGVGVRGLAEPMFAG